MILQGDQRQSSWIAKDDLKTCARTRPSQQGSTPYWMPSEEVATRRNLAGGGIEDTQQMRCLLTRNDKGVRDVAVGVLDPLTHLFLSSLEHLP